MKKEPTSQDVQVRKLYSIMTGIENNLGGGEGVEGLYGSITGTHMQHMLDVMRQHCGLDKNSHLVDVGAGLGRPLLHALFTENIAGATGIELDEIKCKKADAFLKQTAQKLVVRGLTADVLQLPKIECKAIEKIKTLNPCTHAYSFWEGVPVDARAAFGRLFAASSTMMAVTVVQRAMRKYDPAELMDDYYAFGPLVLVDSFSVKMSGSGRSFQAYVFKKDERMRLIAGGRARAARGGVIEERLSTPLRSRDTFANLEESIEGRAQLEREKKAEEEIESPAVLNASPSKAGPRRGSRIRMKSRALAGELFDCTTIEADKGEEEPAGKRKRKSSKQAEEEELSPTKSLGKKKKAKAAPSRQTRSSMQALTNPSSSSSSPPVAAKKTEVAVQQQKMLVPIATRTRGTEKPVISIKKSVVPPSPSKLARGLAGSGLSGNKWRMDSMVADVLEGSYHRQTRRIARELASP